MTASARPESRPAAAWWCRPSLSRRIAVAMILSLVAIQGQAFLQIRYLSQPELRFMGTRWLAEVTADAAKEVFALPPQQRGTHIANRADRSLIPMAWSQSRTTIEPSNIASPVAARLHATLVALLGDDARGIHISASAVSYRFPANAFRLVVVPESVGEGIGSQPVGANEPDVLIPAGVRIAVQGRDGSWLAVEPVGTSDGAFGSTLPYVPLLIGGLIIAFVSTLTARHLMAPLDNLVVAADRVGTSRELVTIPKEGLHEFAAVARAFEEMQHRLLRIVDDRTEMLAAISHDLRSSLTRLTLTTEDVRGDSERRALTTEIEDMQAMVESTLAFASGEARAVPNQRVDVAALLISLVDEAADAGEPCAYGGPDHADVVGQPVALKRAFRNLIDNAIKYGGGARISVCTVGSRIAVEIEDDGPGIPAERLEEAFAPFRRLDPARTDAGVGLGLTIARDVIQAHGGSIEAHHGQAVKFSIAVGLPCAPK